MQRTQTESAHCVDHQTIPPEQATYLIDALMDRIKSIGFNGMRLTIADWYIVADQFNAKFEGKRIPGCVRPQSKQSIEMLHGAMMENLKEFEERYTEGLREYKGKLKEARESKEVMVN